ncbi:MAG: GMP synthase [Bacteroidetes bacterium]|nr:GMP synthase [Bacteroidota bacterium]
MNFTEKETFSIALLDLYEGAANQGMRGIREIVREFGEKNEINIHLKEFDVRQKNELPGNDFDAYISSGGPGSPIESEGLLWDTLYFDWLKRMEDWNNDPSNHQKKHVYLICHSFQLACRYFQIGEINKRHSTSFGIFPMHLTHAGKREPVFKGLIDPFFAVDSRDYQVVKPNQDKIEELGAEILCIEKERAHVPYERAIMGVRFSDYIIGSQFHPEADAIGMSLYLQQEDKKNNVVENHGLAKWQSMIDRLNDPDKIAWTQAHVIPNFLHIALKDLCTELAV